MKSRNRIAIEDLQVLNLVRNPNLVRSIAEQKWRCLAEQLICEAGSAGGEMVQVSAKHTGTDCHACVTTVHAALEVSGTSWILGVGDPGDAPRRTVQIRRRPVDEMEVAKGERAEQSLSRG